MIQVKTCSETNSLFIKSRECLKQKVQKSNISDRDLKDILFVYIDALNDSINSKLITNKNGWDYFNEYYEIALENDKNDLSKDAYIEINNAIMRLQ